jgi:hypothetical protein
VSAAAPTFDGATFEPELDHDRLLTLLNRVRDLMADGNWRTLAQIVQACGGTEASVSARLRDLRKPKFGAHDVRRRRVCGADGLFEYRVIPGATAVQPALQWRMELDAVRWPHWVSIPTGFTVAKVFVPVGGVPTPMYQAFDVRQGPARSIGIYPWLEQAKACAESVLPSREGGESRSPDGGQS